MAGPAEEMPTPAEIPGENEDSQEYAGWTFTPTSLNVEGIVTAIPFADTELKPLEGLPLQVQYFHYDKDHTVDMVDIEIGIIEHALRDKGLFEEANLWHGIDITLASIREYANRKRTLGFLTKQGIFRRAVPESNDPPPGDT